MSYRVVHKKMDELRANQTRLEVEYTAHKEQSHAEKGALEAQLEQANALMAGVLEFVRLPEIRPLHRGFLNRKRAELLQRQREAAQRERERQEAEAHQQSERERHIRQESEAAPQRRRARMR